MNADIAAPASFRIHHTMLPVTDLERSVNFYTRLLGMRVMSRRTDPERGVNAGHVGYGDRATQPSIELIERPASEVPSKPPASRGHIAIAVGDVYGLCARLEREGVVFIAPPKRNASGENHSAWVRDPDGHPLELTERRSEG